MSVNRYNSTTGELTSLAGGTRTWVGTKAAYESQRQAGTLPNDVLIVITDDEEGLATEVTEDDPKAVTSGAVYDAFVESNSTLKDSVPINESNKLVTSDGIYNNCLVAKGDGARSSSDNLNSLSTQGTYSIRSVSTVPQNAPSGYSNVYGILNVFNNKGNDSAGIDYVSQQLHMLTDNSFWFRARTGNTWSSWKKVTTT